SESLPIRWLQMDRRKVRPAVDAARRESVLQTVAADLRRDANHVDEPAHLYARARRRQRLDAFDVREPFVVARRDRRAVLQQLVEPANLRQPERGAEIVEPIVIPDAIVLQPCAVGGAAL